MKRWMVLLALLVSAPAHAQRIGGSGASFTPTDIDTNYGAETVTSAWTMDALTLGGDLVCGGNAITGALSLEPGLDEAIAVTPNAGQSQVTSWFRINRPSDGAAIFTCYDKSPNATCWPCDPDSAGGGCDVSVAIGRNANCSGVGCVAIGRNAGENGCQGTCIGGSTLTNVDSTAIGDTAKAAGAGSTAIGDAVDAGSSGTAASFNVSIGQDIRVGAVVTNQNGIIIGSGWDATASAKNFLAFGKANRAGTNQIASGQILIGGDQQDAPYTEMIIGQGKAHATPAAFTSYLTPALGTDISAAAAVRTIAGGSGTGTGPGGPVVLAYSPAGVSGSSINGRVAALTVRGSDGLVSMAANGGPAPPATCTPFAFFVDTDETDDTVIETVNDNAVLACIATDVWFVVADVAP